LKVIFVYIALSFVLSGCFFQPDKVKTFGLDQTSPRSESGVAKAGVSSVSIVNDQLIINGSELDGVSTVRITGPASFDETFAIESKSASKLIANGLKNISFAIGSVFNLIVSDAYGAATFQVTFTLQDGAVTAAKLDSMGAGIGQVLKYDGSAWVPSDLGGLTYAGNWNANSNSPDLDGGGNLGEYYIVGTAGAHDLLGGAGTNSWSVGDWVVWNNVLGQWEKIDNATNVTSFNSRSGPVTPQTNDYTWAQINKTTSSLGDIADVDTTGIATNKILKWNGSKWIMSDDLSGGGAGSVTTTEIANGTIVDADVSSSAAIAQSKIANLSTDLAGKLPLSGGTMTGNLVMGSNNITLTTGLVDGVDISALNTQVTNNASSIASKESSISAGTAAQYFRGDKSWQTLDTDAVSEGATNKYYSATQARTDLLETASITNGQTTTAPSSDAVFDALALKQDSLGFTPVNIAGDAMTGNLTLNAQSEVRFADSDSSNYVALRSPGAVGTNLTLTLPSADGTNGQVLSTNGTGTLSWITPATGAGDITDVVAGTGLTGGATSGSATLNVDVGTTANKIVQLDGSGRLPAVNGSLLTNLPNPTTSTVVSGFSAGVDATVTNTDTVEIALEKLQGQINGNNTDLAGKLPLSGGTMTGNLVMGSNNITLTTGLVDGVDVSALNTQVTTNATNIAAKESSIATGTTAQYFRGDKSWQTLDTDAVSEGATNKYYSATQARTDLLETASITNGQTTTAPSSDAVFDALALKQDSLGFTPVNIAGDAMTGNLTLNAQSEVRFADSDSSNYVALRSPGAVGTNLTLTLPSADGTNGQVLSTNGTGTLSWITPATGAGDITDVVAGTGLTGGATSGSATLNVDVGTTANKIVQLDGSGRLPAVNGSLLTNLPNPTTSTVVSGFSAGADSSVTNTDTVEVALEKLQGQINGNNTDLAGKEPTLTKGNLTEATSSVLTITGGAGAVIGTGTTIQVAQASTSTSGYLSNADWNTFNNKQSALTNPITGTGTSGQVAYFNGTTTQTSSANLAFDGANLSVGGDIKLGNNAATCNAGNEGRQRYNSTYKNMQFCDGTYWREVGSPYWASSKNCVPAENTSDEMVPVGSYCVDKYEASVWSDRAASGTQYFSNGASSDLNYPDAGNLPASFNRDGSGSDTVYAVSKAGVIPGRGVTWYQASIACANSGKELIPDHIWQTAVLGTTDPGSGSGTGGSAGGSAADAAAAKCNINTNTASSGTWIETNNNVRPTNRAGATAAGTNACISRYGVEDMIGNLWEWTSMNGMQAGADQTAFSQGESNASGNPFSTSDASWNINGSAKGCDGPGATKGTCGWKNNVAAAALRGGRWADGTKAGAFALLLTFSGSYSSWDVGFRCARSR
jgi:formylglycine-generating enzyme required for sulfatase activity